MYMFTRKSFKTKEELKHLPRAAKEARGRAPYTGTAFFSSPMSRISRGRGRSNRFHFNRTSKILQESREYTQSCLKNTLACGI